MTSFCAEIMQQPDSLRKLIGHYQHQAPELLSNIPAPEDLLLTGMGASLHAAQVGAYHLQSLGKRAISIEAGDLVQYGAPLLDGRQEIIYISQSGQSAEVAPLLALTKDQKVFAAVTNEPHSLLAASARYTLPLAVAQETLVATQTYVNSLAILWMLTRRWAGIENEEDEQLILRLADFMEKLLAQSDAIANYWLEKLKGVEFVVFTGFGLHSATARQSAQTVAEWTKVPVLGLSAGALRHGFIEIIGSKTGVVIFSGNDQTWKLASRLADELNGYGAKVLIVQSGQTNLTSDRMDSGEHQNEFLAPMLDVIPAQLYAEALAAELGVPPGFRYLSKVVKRV